MKSLLIRQLLELGKSIDDVCIKLEILKDKQKELIEFLEDDDVEEDLY